jgi:putative transcriptional regulator
MTKAFEKIMAGLLDAKAYMEGDAEGSVTHVVVADHGPDVAAVRKALKLSRPKFAERFGLDARAIQDWEQGRRKPDRAARVLIGVIARHPAIVEDVVKATRGAG